MRRYLKDCRVGAATGYDPDVDQLFGYNDEMAKLPYLKEIDLDNPKGWVRTEVDAEGVPTVPLMTGTTVADTPEAAVAAAIAAAAEMTADPGEQPEDLYVLDEGEANEPEPEPEPEPEDAPAPTREVKLTARQRARAGK